MYSWDEIAKVGRLTANLVVVFEARRMKGITPLQSDHRGCKAAGYLSKARKNKHSHTDSILPSLAAEGAMHE